MRCLCWGGACFFFYIAQSDVGNMLVVSFCLGVHCAFIMGDPIDRLHATLNVKSMCLEV